MSSGTGDRALAAIVESSQDAILSKAADGTITTWNAGAQRLYGYSAEEAIGRPIAILEPPGRAGETDDILRRVLSGEVVDHHETQRLAKDGTVVEVSLTVSPLRDGEGKIVGASAVARDVSERRRAEQYRDTLLGLTRVVAEHDDLDEAAPRILEAVGASLGWDLGGLWLVDGDGRSLDLTHRWAAQDADGEEAAGQGARRLALGEGLPGQVWASRQAVWVLDAEEEDLLRSALIAAKDVHAAVALPVWHGQRTIGVIEFFSHHMRRPDARLEDLLTAVGGQVGSFVVRVATAAEVRKAKQAAERASRAKSEFMSHMSHELRTPLNAILGFAQLLELDELDERQRESVAQVLKAGRHLLQLIDEVLDIARIEAGELRISLEPVSVSEVVDESLTLVAPLAERRRIELSADLGQGQGSSVLADRQRLKQVLLNLLSNAIKYNREAGRVDVLVERLDDQRLALRVRDTGPGIPPEQQARLFEPFERLGAEATEVEGTGLGLALSRRLTEMMDGALTVDSTPGAGTTMSIELRSAVGAQAAETVPEGPPAPDLGGRTLLYIEDNLANLRLIERLLERLRDVRLLPAMQGKIGLELAREHRPDAILLDLHLPDLPGHEVLLRLRAEPALRSTPVLVISADATDRQRRRMLEAGAHAYLTKPLDVREFLDAVEECLDSRAETR